MSDALIKGGEQQSICPSVHLILMAANGLHDIYQCVSVSAAAFMSQGI